MIVVNWMDMFNQ